MVLTSIGRTFASDAKHASAKKNDSPTNAYKLAGARRLYLRTIAAHSASRPGISLPSEMGSGGQVFMPSASAMVGHKSSHEATSPLVMLKISLRAAGVAAAHSIERARRSVSTISNTDSSAPGNGSGKPASRRSAAYTPIAGIRL